MQRIVVRSKVLKGRLIKEGNETVTNCYQLKLPAADGKKRLTDMADLQGIFRLIQSIPSKKAEPVKQWLAQLVPLHPFLLAQSDFGRFFCAFGRNISKKDQAVPRYYVLCPYELISLHRTPQSPLLIINY